MEEHCERCGAWTEFTIIGWDEINDTLIHLRCPHCGETFWVDYAKNPEWTPK